MLLYPLTCTLHCLNLPTETKTKVLVLKGLQFPMLSRFNDIPQKHPFSAVAEESFRVYRRILKEYLPKRLVFSKKFHEVLATRKILYITRAVTFDKNYYDKFTIDGPSEAFISESKNSAWHLMGAFGRSMSLEDCQRRLLDEGWLFLPLLKPHKAFELAHKVKPIDIESPIYKDFEPEGLRKAYEEQQKQEREERLKKLRKLEKLESFSNTLKKELFPQAPLAETQTSAEIQAILEAQKPPVVKVKPVITHPATSEVDKSLNAMNLAIRLGERMQKRIRRKQELEEKIKLELTKKLSDGFQELQFRSKRQMLDYIKARMESQGKDTKK